MVDQPVAGPLLTQDNTNRISRRTTMSGVRFEPTIPVFEREKIFYGLDCAVTLIDGN
jgi:hypothetical protein